MSLINDALKRAEQQKFLADGSLAPRALADEMAILTPGREPRRGQSRAIVLIAAAVLAGGAVVAWQMIGARSGGSTPQKATAAVAKPAAPNAPAQAQPGAARSASTQPANSRLAAPGLLAPAISPAAAAEARAIIEKSLAAIKYYTPPAAGSADLLDALTDEDFAQEWEGEAEALTPAPAAKPPAVVKAAPAPVAKVAAAPAPAAKPATPPPAGFDAAKYKVAGVLLDEENSSAVINGRILKLGDSIDGAKVVKITARNVEVEVGGRLFVLGS